MDGDAAEGAGDITLVARRNNSLSSGSRLLVLGSLAAVVLAISLGFALSGAWLILPFAGLELLVVGLAFRYMEQHAADYECMTMHGDQVVIELAARQRKQIRIQPPLGAADCPRAPGHGRRQVGVAIPRKGSGIRHSLDR